MSFIGKLLGDVVGGITGAKQAGEAAERAGQTQAASAEKGIEEQRRQFDALVELMSPYVTAGQGAIGQQQALIGLQGPEAQRAATAGFEQSPLFQSMIQQGENAILQNASATGGLRGGNIQGALAQFRPQALNALIEQQYGRLGGMTSLGQASAASVGSAGMQTGANIGNIYSAQGTNTARLLGEQGAAQAGGEIAQGRAFAAIPQAISGGLGIYSGLGGKF